MAKSAWQRTPSTVVNRTVPPQTPNSERRRATLLMTGMQKAEVLQLSDDVSSTPNRRH